MKNTLANAAGVRVMVLCEKPDSTLTRIRLTIPLRIWADKAKGQLLIRSFDDFKLLDAEAADVYVVQRASSAFSLVIVRYLQVSGRLVVYDIDDLLTEIPVFLAHHDGLIKKRKIIADIIRQVNFVTCTQSILAQKMAEINRNVWICPNYGDPYFELPDSVSPVDGEDATLVVAATDRVLVDFILGAIKNILLKYKKRVRLVVIGPIGDKFQDANIEADYFPIIEHGDFTRFIAAMHNPVGVIPLDDSLFSSCKSAIKYFDYSVAGLATICSDVAPYNKVINDGVDGYVVQNIEADWYKAIDRLVSDRGLRGRIAAAAREKVLVEFGVDTTVNAWISLFEIINSHVFIPPTFSALREIWLKILFFILRWNRRRIGVRRGRVNVSP